MSDQATLVANQKVVVEREIGGQVFRMETGELAKQASGSVLVTYGETIVLVTACCNDTARRGQSFFPLTVDYEEKMYSAGKIPGGWIKREGRPPERTILTCRLIDRPIRPLFPEGFRNDVHVVGMCLSSDESNEPDVLALSGAGAALSLSEIPFEGPVAGVRVGYVDGEFLINPTWEQQENSLLNLVVAGTRDNIMMVECAAFEVTEDLLLDAFDEGHEAIRTIIEMIDEMVAQAGKPKREFSLALPDAGLEKAMRKHMSGSVGKAMRTFDRQERQTAFDRLGREYLAEILRKEGGEENERLLGLLEDEDSPDFGEILKLIKGDEMVDMIIQDGVRSDGRKPKEIRSLDAQVGVLPRAHGTGLFTRGQTQVLSLLTLGTLAEEQTFDNVFGESSKRYIHHYSFPPFSVGEARFMRGPGRREIGHGALAEKALIPVIPDEDEFPYTIRVVSECLESNGSTSMASTCGSTLALMDAGVPIKAPVGGIAMGLVKRGDDFVVLTDIQGLEDHLGEMDFKVTGTREGVTAVQMDIKLKGITTEILKIALEQAKEARYQILDVIEEAIPAPRPELSPRAPRITSITIDPDKIKDIIGPGGKNINRIIAETGVKIDIENDGRVYVAAVSAEAVKRALKMIEDQLRDVEPGEVYTGKVMRVMSFGAFVEVLPGKEGLLHISKIKPFHLEKVEDALNIGDEVEVKVEEIDSLGRVNLTRKGLYTEEELEEAESRPAPRDRGDRGGRGGDRGDRRDRGDRGDRGDRKDRGGRERSGRPPRGGDRPQGQRSHGSRADEGEDKDAPPRRKLRRRRPQEDREGSPN